MNPERMAEDSAQRRLAAILAADVAGYSRLMSVDEASTLNAFKSHLREFIEPKIAEHHGRVFKMMGDGMLVEFASVIEAVKCAVQIQNGMAQRNIDEPEDAKIEFRMGINLGDVIVDNEDVFGDGVNVAARLEALADPGEICISRSARDQVRDKLDYGLEDWGEVEVKNIPRPVRVFRVLTDRHDAGKTTGRSPQVKLKYTPAIAALALLLAATTIGVTVWKPWSSDVEVASVENMAFPLPDRPSIAVLAFRNMSDDKDQQYFADGIAEDIITDMSKVSGIFVVARDSTFSYKGKPAKVRKIAEDLGVRYVLEGSVRRAGDKMRITAQLTDAVKGTHIWADRYDRDATDVFAVQSEITGHVVKALAVTLKASEHDRLFQKYVTTIDAYDAFLRARATVDAPTRSNIETGEMLFKRVIDLDPQFAGGYAGLSFNYSVKARFRFGEDPKSDAALSLKYAQQAIAADRRFAWSHIALAGAYLANNNHDEAVDAVAQALVIQPSGYEANLFSGFYLNFAGRPEPAVRYLETANTLSRIDTIRGLDFLGMAYFTAGKYAECEATWTRRFERFGVPNYPIGHVFLASAQALQGKTSDAKKTVERFLRIAPEFRMAKWLWINNYKLAEDRNRLYAAAIAAGVPE